ncbi:Alpha-N-acetylglucosaminidase tim-barrel domain [Trinorchestia longiramus]|nr:Alpha-N-acetylglucosaminidase tim-barrel domain [Trinorchestia longiramus]
MQLTKKRRTFIVEKTYMLEPTDPLFHRIGVILIEEMRATYNYTDGVYNCDPYNEQTPHSTEPSYMAKVGSSIYGTLAAVDTDAVWLLQGWFLLNEFWTPELAEGLLTSVPKGRILVLDLAAEVTPVYNKFDNFYGQPFIFCMLNNYGGADGLFGNVDMLLDNLAIARGPNTTLVGTGLTMEGIDQNYVMYDFMMELAWGEPPDNVSDWAARYAVQRYGSSAPQEAWRYLIVSKYFYAFGGEVDCTAELGNWDTHSAM